MTGKIQIQRSRELNEGLHDLEAQLNRTTEVLRALISWMAQTAGSPISQNDAKILLTALEDESNDG